jgi:hypothetical protein
VAVGFWRLLFGLAYFGLIRLTVPDSLFFTRLPKSMQGHANMNAVLDCIGGPIFLAVGVAAIVSALS